MSGQHAGGRRRRLPPALLAAGGLAAAGVVAALVAAASGTEGSPSAATSSAHASHTPPPTATPTTATPVRTAQRARRLPGAGPPRRIVMDSLGIDASVVPVATEGSSLDPPADPQLLGWWSGGAPAGAARGSTLVTGHTVHDGGGAMDDLEDAAVGAEVRVVTDRGSLRYVTRSVQVLDKAALAQRAPRLFSQTVAGRLVLVTCEDWDGSGYRSNVVLTAVPAR